MFTTVDPNKKPNQKESDTDQSRQGYLETLFNDDYHNQNKKSLEAVLANKYTPEYMILKNMRQFLNADCRRIIDFGSGCGVQSILFKQEGWDLIAYDYCEKALRVLEEQHAVTVRNVDFNHFDPMQITHDLKQVANIVCIDLLTYLDEASRINFLFHIMDNAQPNSVYFIASYAFSFTDKIAIRPDLDGKELQARLSKQTLVESDMKSKHMLKENFVVSFFAPRTDIVLRHRQKGDLPVDLSDDLVHFYHDILIMHKR